MLNWVIPGVLARSCRPGWAPGGRREPVSPDVLSGWIQDVKVSGIRSVLVLLADEHLRLYEGVAGGLLAAYRASGLVVAHISILDHQPKPVSPAELDAAFRSFCALPRPTLVHCSAGIDRTGAVIRHLLDRRGEWMTRPVGEAASTPDVPPAPERPAPMSATSVQAILADPDRDEIKVLGVDLAVRSWADNGSVLLVFGGDPPAWRSCAFGVIGPVGDEALTADSMARAIDAYALAHDVRAVSLDGPQGWRSPDALDRSGVGRACEAEARTPGRTGVYPRTFPGTYNRWVRFAIDVFEKLRSFGRATLVNEKTTGPLAVPEAGHYLILECFPTSTWRTSGLRPLPGHSKATRAIVRAHAATLRDCFGLPDAAVIDHHDHLQALVAALPAAALLGGPCIAVPRGEPGSRQSAQGDVPSHWVEGFSFDAKPPQGAPPPAPPGDQRPHEDEPNDTINPILPDLREPASQEVIERGVRLFLDLVCCANAGHSIGIGFADFVRWVYNTNDYTAVMGRNFQDVTDSKFVIRLAQQVTKAAGGRRAVTKNGVTIQSGMDTFIWRVKGNHDRPRGAWLVGWCQPPYTRKAWKQVFPDGTRRVLNSAHRDRPICHECVGRTHELTEFEGPTDSPEGMTIQDLHAGPAGADTTAPIQARNVGNRGDTLKHAPIPDLVRILLAASGRVAYFDPFAFALEYPLSPSVGFPRWLEDLRARQRRRRAYGGLRDIQGPRLAAGLDYRCGIGLTLDAIGPDRLSWLLVAERDPGLRARLEAVLREMGLVGSLVGGAVLPDAAGIPDAIAGAGASVQSGDGLFALIDPFTIPGCPWAAVLEGLALAMRPGVHGIALVFTFGIHDWPIDLSPAGALRRVRLIGEGPFHLAVYATEALTDVVARVLDGFGWT